MTDTAQTRHVPRWFERTFQFPYPVELLPNLLARLRGTPARLEDALRGRSHEQLIARPNGTWSAQENAGHLLALEPLGIARVEDYVRGSEQLTPTDLQNSATDNADYNARLLDDVLADFRSARVTFLYRVEALDAIYFTRAVPHPRLKTPMLLSDFLFFVAEHDDHHLARIWELLHDPD